MANPTRDEILFRSGGAEVIRTGVAWLRGSRVDGREVEKYTHTRADSATVATYTDRDGAIRTAAAGKARCSWDYTNTRAGLLLEGSRTNLVLYSQDMGQATWANSGTPTITTGNTVAGSVSLDLIGDDDGGVAEAKVQSFATGVVATGCNALSVHWNAGSAATTVVVFDNGVNDRLRFSVSASGNAPLVTVSVGAILATIALANNVYRMLFQTTTCLVTDSHRLIAYPAGTTASATGNVNIGGWGLENAPYPSSYIATTTNTVTRAADAMTLPIGFAPQDFTVYVRMPRPAWADATGSLDAARGIIGIGVDASVTLGAILYGVTSARQFAAWIGGQNVTQAIPAGSTLELCAQFRYTTDGTCKLDVGSGFGAASSAGSLTFGSATLRLGSYFSGTELGGAIERLVIARGLFTLAEMQSVQW